MKQMLKKMTALCLVCAGALSTHLTYADMVTFNFTGTRPGDPGLIPNVFFDTDQEITGSFTFDPTVPATYPNPQNPNIVYYNNLVSFSMNFGGYLLTYNPTPVSSPPLGTIVVGNDNAPEFGLSDTYQVWANTEGSNIAGLSVDYVVIDFFDTDALALSSLELPLSPAALSAFVDRTFNVELIDFTNPDNPDYYSLQFPLTALSAVPEPSKSFLYLSGLMLVGLARWKVRRSNFAG